MDPTDDGEAEGTGDSTSDVGAASFSYLSDLADKVNERRPTEPADEKPESDDSGVTDAPEVTDDPLEAVRELLAERRPHLAPGRDSDSRTGKSRRMVYIGVGLTVALMVTGVLAVTAPQQERVNLDPNEDQPADPLATISLSAEDAAFMNRVFRESSHEVAYCGIVDADGDESRMEIWLADTVSSSPGEIEFRTTNCPSANQEMLLHTHPNGGLDLSETDRDTLESQPEEYMCVQAGQLSEEPGTVLENLACYYEGQSDGPGSQPVRVPVVITDT